MSEQKSPRLNAESPVGIWVARHPQTADVFDTLRIDYCCDGDKSLEKACWENGLEVIRVHSLLQRTIADIDDATIDDWLGASLSDLCNDIEETHHAFLKNSLPTVTSLFAQVIELHGDKHPELLDARDYFVTWRNEIREVMAEVERSVFPTIRQLEDTSQPANCNVGGVLKLMRRITLEHKDIGDALKKARQASSNFVTPKGVGPAYAQLFGLLRRMEADVRHHVHKEEFILFPRVLELGSGVH